MKALVLNLKSRPDRLRQFLRWNRAQPLEFEFLEAVAGATLDRQELQRRGLLAPGTENWSAGALGHALSTRQVWLRCVEEKRPLLVLEDDICLRGDFVSAGKPLQDDLGDGCDFIYLGYNTDAAMVFAGPEGLKNVLFFDESCKREADYFERFSRLAPGHPVTMMRCLQAWGMPAYLITPAGARKLLAACFPLVSSPPLPMMGQSREIAPYSIDALINQAILRRVIQAWCCLPPLALGPNDHQSSDVITGG